MSTYTVEPIGFVRSSRDAAIDDDWDAVTAVIELDASQVQPDATQGLDTFSHIEVVFLFDQVDPGKVCRDSRHPRGNSAWPRVGILAQRAKDRPNRIGLTTCRVLRVDGLRIEVSGLDAIDGTPVLDIKPLMDGFAARGERREPAWATELMADYW
ncbi:MAG: SAM-dependent methyltransferase [Actinomycetia bacterium]|nr:SAM-dependent methyltransferase [Actinomycetes bacterium]